MENNYQYRRNQRDPDPEEIRRHMDFEALMQAYQAAPAPGRRPLRVRRLYSALSVAAAIALLLVVGQQWGLFGDQLTTTESYLAQQELRHAPLADLRAAPEKQTVDAQQGGVIEYASGSRLVIPAGAFMNERGRQIGGEVDVYYHELHDYVDFFLAGVPMRYDSVGVQRFLTSAGMIEIYATQNGKRVNLASDKAIQVELVSDIYTTDFFTPPTYYVYQLDTVTRNWAYRNIDIMQFVESDDLPRFDTRSPEWQWRRQVAELEADYEQAVMALLDAYPLPSAPVAPHQADGSRPTLELDFQDGRIQLDPSSELSQEDLSRLHRGTIWEILPESPAIDPNAFRVNWERVALRNLDGRRYELTLIHSQNQASLIVQPVLLGADYTAANDRYATELAAYEAAVAARENQLVASRDSLQVAFQARKDALEVSFRDQLEQSVTKHKRRVVSRFVVNDFGLWNCAQPIEQATVVQAVNYEAANGEQITETLAYVASAEQNTLFRYYADQGTELGLTPGVPNLIWVVSDGQLLLTEITQLGDGSDLVLAPVPVPESEAALREILEL
jgi:hypothetical protein